MLLVFSLYQFKVVNLSKGSSEQGRVCFYKTELFKFLVKHIPVCWISKCIIETSVQSTMDMTTHHYSELCAGTAEHMQIFSIQ